MKVRKDHKKSNCPKCGSDEILTLGLDQMCCDCDWDNSLLLVKLGQLDNLVLAGLQHFEGQLSFDNMPVKINRSQPQYESQAYKAITA